jgi:hypothetical protein
LRLDHGDCEGERGGKEGERKRKKRKKGREGKVAFSRLASSFFVLLIFLKS